MIVALLVVAAAFPLVSSATPAYAATAPATTCNFLQRLLGQCPKAPTPTPTPAPSPTPPAPTPTPT
ncbi:MAG TPA: hypothetical protein VFV09_01045, partial [Actinomycetota bacterium]|nr:hypothetical protein [Actinomycetota bacterium]